MKVLLLSSIWLCALLASSYELQIPSEVYENARGTWSVEFLSACRPPTYGEVTFENTTATVKWSAETEVPPIIISGVSTESSLSLGGLAPFMAKDGVEHSYTICETQDNYLATPRRPRQVATMTSTYLKEYTGLLATAQSGEVCSPAAPRTVSIRVMGMPLPPPPSSSKWELHEALYTIEMTLSTKGLDDACSVKRSAVEPVSENKKRSRRRRLHRSTDTGAVTSEADEVAAERGLVVVRFVRRSFQQLPFFQRYNGVMLFGFMFIFYRVIYSFFSNREAVK